DVVVAVAAIAARAFNEDAPNLGGIDLQGFGKVLTKRKYALCVRPDGQFLVAEFGKRAGRPHRGMGDVRFAIGRFHDARAGGRRARLLLTRHRADGPQREQLLIDLIRVGELDAARPARTAAQRGTRLDRLLLALRDDADEAAVAHDSDDSRHGLDRGVVEY